MAGAGLCLVLAACSCSTTADRRPKPQAETRVLPADKVHFDATAGRQVVQLAWSREGRWTRVDVLGEKGPQPGMIARDRFGARLVTIPTGVGYLVTRIDLDCQRGLAHLSGTRAASRDDLRVDTRKAVPTARVMIPQKAVRAACAGPDGSGGQDPNGAVQALRQVQVTKPAADRITTASDAVAAIRRAQEAHGGGMVAVTGRQIGR